MTLVNTPPDTTLKENTARVVAPTKYDEAARLLTGRELQDGVPTNLDEKDWREFSELATSNWNRYDNAIGKPMMRWAKTEVSTPDTHVFYPFSGPDFTTLFQLFPNKEHYVMTAMQRGEQLIDLRKLFHSAGSQTLEVMGSAWNSFGHDGFFVTEYLFKYLSTNRVKIGATSLIAAFLNLHGFSIQDIVPIQINANGNIEELSKNDSWDSVRFFLTKDGKNVTLDYVRMDLSNDGLNKNENHLTFFQKSTQHPVLLKAASHLPQHPGFTLVRNAILENAPMVVQDETGLDYKPLSEKFNTVLYGQFVKAYKVFSTYNKELAHAYKDRTDEKPLPFRVGYYKDGNYAFIVAKRK